MKRIVSCLLSIALVLTGCTPYTSTNHSSESVGSVDNEEITVIEQDELKTTFDTLDDPELLRYVEDHVYMELLDDLSDDGYFVENVEAAYYSKEYLEELGYNSQSSIYFGYNLDELDAHFSNTRYAFTLDNDGQTTVIPLLEFPDDTNERIVKNVAIGSGVILLSITVSVVTAGAGAPAVSMIFAASAKTGATFALSSSVFSGVSSAIVTGYQTGDFSAALKVGVANGSEGFKWGAISGFVAGGGKEFFALKKATLNGLTMNQAATIQKESKYPVDLIKQFHNIDEYKVFKGAGLKSDIVNGKLALIRDDIDLFNITDEMGRNNMTRMSQGLAPLDVNGYPFELHHVGQKNNAALAILTKAEHDSSALHGFVKDSEIDRPAFDKIRKAFWKAMAVKFSGGGA